MKPWGRFLFIFLAYGIALLHTGVPHHHVQSGAGQPVYVHAGCLYAHSFSGSGLLQKVLSTDLGVGHLETFKKNAEPQIDFSRTVALFAGFSPILALQAVQGVAVTPAFLQGYIEKFKKRLLLSSAALFRGPPVPA